MILPSLNQDKKAEAARIEALFSDAQWIEAHTLLSATTMLDIYGEAIRDRAYIVNDPIAGDLVLRPDFTVPVVETHMKSGASPARYAYSGRVWRKRKSESAKHSFWQIGYESFDSGDKAKLDAEIFAKGFEIAASKGLSAKTGDLGLIFSILAALELPEWRHRALARHVWRPKAFARLLSRYSVSEPKHASWLDQADFDDAVPFHGKRTRGMIEARIERLREDCDVAPIDAGVKALIDRALSVKGTLAEAEDQFRNIASEFAPLAAFAENFSKRNQELVKLGVDLNTTAFDAGFGRETMEYYDGFVFEFGNAAISGGRYDGLTSRMGDGEIGAIGMACRLDRLTGSGL